MKWTKELEDFAFHRSRMEGISKVKPTRVIAETIKEIIKAEPAKYSAAQKIIILQTLSFLVQ
jgi:hypothetical protein